MTHSQHDHHPAKSIDELEQKGTLRLTRGEIMKSDSEIATRAPILRPSDVVHNRAPEWESEESDEPLHVDLPTARIGELAVCLHFSPGATCLITESFDGSIPTKGIVGQTQAKATQILKDLGLVVKVKTLGANKAKKVINVSPKEGTKVKRGSTVTITVG